MTSDPLFPPDRSIFVPPCCPRRDCDSRSGRVPFQWIKKGSYRRACDGRSVPRFLCRACGRKFSLQSFRLSYGLKRPELTRPAFEAFVSKVTMRQCARTVKCSRKTVEHRLRLLGRHCRAVHATVLARSAVRGGLPGDFQLDELETFEGSRRLQPVTMPVLIELHKRFVVHVDVGTLPARGKLSPRDQERKLELAATHGTRRNESSECVTACLSVLKSVLPPQKHFVISSDRKSSYPRILRDLFRPPYTHARHSSTSARTPNNPLFPINHTLGMLRDGVSRLVRRTWASSKLKVRLCDHAWIWSAYRNYVRPLTNRARSLTSAVALGVVAEVFQAERFLTWLPLPLEHQAHSPGPVSDGGEATPPAHSPSTPPTPDSKSSQSP